MTSPSKNDITGDRLISKPANDAYRDNWDRIFGKQKQKENHPEQGYYQSQEEKPSADSPDRR